jgi:hypothetical protein
MDGFSFIGFLKIWTYMTLPHAKKDQWLEIGTYRSNSYDSNFLLMKTTIQYSLGNKANYHFRSHLETTGNRPHVQAVDDLDNT